MGCASSKRIEATTAVYHPPPTSFAVLDINAIEEPWLKHLNNTATTQLPQDKSALPPPILHKLNMLDATEAPQSWDEVSKTLQDLKPMVQPQPPPPSTSPPPTPPQQQQQQQQQQQPPRKVASFHTLEELDAKLTPKPNPPAAETKINTKTNKRIEYQPLQPPPQSQPMKDDGGDEGVVRIKPVKENIFIVKDRMERQKEEKETNYERLRRNPLSQYPEKCPPGGNDAVVIYTTSLGGVRKTFEECNRARDLLEGHRVVFDERDVSLHGEFLKELKELLVGETEAGVALPRVFVKGRYLGGLGELLELNETGRLGRILNATRVERGVGRLGCGGCGGARFVPCLDCGGSCKLVLTAAGTERCPKCNENGLVHCPACL